MFYVLFLCNSDIYHQLLNTIFFFHLFFFLRVYSDPKTHLNTLKCFDVIALDNKQVTFLLKKALSGLLIEFMQCYGRLAFNKTIFGSQGHNGEPSPALRMALHKPSCDFIVCCSLVLIKVRF